MLIDIVFVFIVVLAVFKGLGKGLIIGIFSFLAFIIGLAAALKLSGVVAGYLESYNGASAKWIPIISFLVVFLVVVFLVNLGARVIQKSIQFAMLGWLDKLGGVVFYALIYTIIFSIILFFATKTFLLSPETIAGSYTYKYLAPLGPEVMNYLGKIIPVFKGLFVDLQNFFESLKPKMSA